MYRRWNLVSTAVVGDCPHTARVIPPFLARLAAAQPNRPSQGRTKSGQHSHNPHCAGWRFETPGDGSGLPTLQCALGWGRFQPSPAATSEGMVTAPPHADGRGGSRICGGRKAAPGYRLASLLGTSLPLPPRRTAIAAAPTAAFARERQRTTRREGPLAGCPPNPSQRGVKGNPDHPAHCHAETIDTDPSPPTACERKL